MVPRLHFASINLKMVILYCKFLWEGGTYFYDFEGAKYSKESYKYSMIRLINFDVIKTKQFLSQQFSFHFPSTVILVCPFSIANIFTHEYDFFKIIRTQAGNESVSEMIQFENFDISKFPFL